MSFLLSIFVFILFIGLFIILAIFGFIRSLFTFGRRNNAQNYQQQNSGYDNPPAAKPKIFDKKEGEYVDFEEVE